MYLMTRAVLPQMPANGGGSIVCTVSISAVYAAPNEVLYDASKGACHMFARAIAVEFRDRGIRCNAVCPGFIATPHGDGDVERLMKYGVDVSDAAIAAAQGRMGKPEDVARAAPYLASDDAEFINGAQLFIDNGFRRFDALCLWIAVGNLAIRVQTGADAKPREKSMSRHLADHRARSSGGRVKHFLRLSRTPRDTWLRPRGTTGASRLVQFLRIERGRNA